MSGGPGRPPLSGHSVALSLRNKLRKQKNDFLIFKARRVDTVGTYGCPRGLNSPDASFHLRKDALVLVIYGYRQLQGQKLTGVLCPLCLRQSASSTARVTASATHSRGAASATLSGWRTSSKPSLENWRATVVG